MIETTQPDSNRIVYLNKRKLEDMSFDEIRRGLISAKSKYDDEYEQLKNKYDDMSSKLSELHERHWSLNTALYRLYQELSNALKDNKGVPKKLTREDSNKLMACWDALFDYDYIRQEHIPRV